MKKVYLQFRTKSDLLQFLEQTSMPLCVVDSVKNRILTELPEEVIELAQKKFKASIIAEEDNGLPNQLS